MALTQEQGQKVADLMARRAELAVVLGYLRSIDVPAETTGDIQKLLFELGIGQARPLSD